jgi:hypothetical protein
MATYAPEPILEVRRYLKPITGLSDIELGIVGNLAHDGGYHHGWSQRDSDGTDYSWDESPRDWNAKSEAARALDIGMFDRLRELSIWLVNECEKNRRDPTQATDCADIREIIYSPDGVNVKRWDRLGIRNSGDKSHITHTHIDWFADALNKSKVGPFKRFFEGEQDMDLLEHTALLNSEHYLQSVVGFTDKAEGISDTQNVFSVENKLTKVIKALQTDVTAIKAAVSQPAEIEMSDADVQRIADAVAAKLSPQLEAIVRSIFADAGSKTDDGSSR